MQKMFKRVPPENALEELMNLLASRSFDELSNNDVEVINKKYNFTVTSKYKTDIEKLFSDYLTYYLNIEIPNEGILSMQKISSFLGIPSTKTGELYTPIAIEVYKRRFESSVKNRRLLDEDDENLDKLSHELHLPENITENISAEIRRNVIQAYVDSIIADGEISPEEDQELQDSAASLKVQLSLNENTKQVMEKMRRVWQINHGELPIISPDVILPKNEICHYIKAIDWYEHRSVRNNIQYAGPTFRLKIAKGFYYRVGSINYNQQSKEELIKIDSGKLYITNKRLLFVGGKKNTSIQFGKIINIQPYKNGVEIIKDSGRNPFIALDNDVDECSALLIRLLVNG
jgi:hypothetical protein